MAGLARREVLATVETPLLILATRQDKLVDAKIHTEVLGSDHCPVELEINL